MVLLILAFTISLAAVSAVSTPVSVHYGEDATFSWPLPDSVRGMVVRVVNQYGAPVLDWSPDCTVTPSSSYTHRIRSSCNDASRVTFTLRGVTWPDEGSYTCTSLSDARIPDCGQNLNLVKVPPKVHIELSTPDTGAMDTKGKYLTLTCVVTEAAPSVPEDGYSWSYLPSSHGQLRPLVGKTSTLTLGPLTREDSGQYFCQASNDPVNRWKILSGMASYAFNTSCIDALLHSDISPQAVVEKDRDSYKAVFQLAQHPRLILVQHPNKYIITDWHPPCNFSVTEAFKERVTNTSCDPCRGMLTFSLVNVTTRDLGWYQCYAGTTNGARIESCSVELISKVPIQVHIEPVTPGAVVTAAEEGRLTLTCVVTEAFPLVPKEGYSWRYLPSPQGQLRPLVGKTNTLTFDPVTRKDSGQYFCEARNDLTNGGKVLPGIASVTVDVSYIGRIKSSSDLKVNEGDHVTLTCSVDSKPTARLAWVVEGQEVRHVTANEDQYVLERAACSDSKTYTCRASNPDLPDLNQSACITLTVNCRQDSKVSMSPSQEFTARAEKPSGAVQVCNKPDEKAQALDGLKPWLIAVVVLVIIMPTAAVAVIIYCVRRQGRKSSKKSLLDDPVEIHVELQQPNSKEAFEVSTTDTSATTGNSSDAVHNGTKLDGEESVPLLGVKAMEGAVSSSQAATTGAMTEQSTEAVELHTNFGAGEEPISLIDLKGAKGSVRRPLGSTSDTTPRAEESLAAVQPRAKLDEEEETDPLLEVEDAKSSTSDMTPKAGTSSEAVPLRVKLDEEGETGPLLGVKVSRGSFRRSQEPTTNTTSGAEVPSEADQMRTKPKEGETDRMLEAEDKGDTA